MKGFVILPHRRERTFFGNPTLKGPSPAPVEIEASVEFIS